MLNSLDFVVKTLMIVLRKHFNAQNVYCKKISNEYVIIIKGRIHTKPIYRGITVKGVFEKQP